MSDQSGRSIDSVYDEIAGLTGNRAELERERYLLIKAIRALRAIQQDSAAIFAFTPEAIQVFDMAIVQLETVKTELWATIERTDGGIARLTELVQNGAFNE